MTVETHILDLRLIGIFELVGQTRTTGGFDAQPQADPFATPFKIARDMLCCRFSQCDRHAALPLAPLRLP